ncbi:hypothetical protein GE21DRAFT_1038748 [Neurospora crassa]|nr:hypothetical protein GE21DRAFT_1038748 [Neurospora crassa]
MAGDVLLFPCQNTLTLAAAAPPPPHAAWIIAKTITTKPITRLSIHLFNHLEPVRLNRPSQWRLQLVKLGVKVDRRAEHLFINRHQPTLQPVSHLPRLPRCHCIGFATLRSSSPRKAS